MTLTPYEIILLRYVAQGYKSKDIAAEIGLRSARDVQNRLNSIYRKLGYSGQSGPRARAAAWYAKYKMRTNKSGCG